MKKVLIITYYWPPSGGAGVQRWVKFTKYLSRLGHEPIVLTVDPEFATYPQIDKTLIKDVPNSVKVYHTKSFEPYSVYKKVSSNKEVPYGGFANTKKLDFKEKVLRFIRGNFFLPDPRRGWNKYAIAKAKEIIKKHNIDTVITTSPPHSTQLIGLKLKKQLGIKWIADFRDPWTDIYYFNDLYPTFLATQCQKQYEKKVIQNCDKLITVSKDFKRLFSEKVDQAEDKIVVIPNGFDEDDFAGFKGKNENDKFYISHIGTVADNYNLDGFIQALMALPRDVKEKTGIRFIGKISPALIDKFKKAGIENMLEVIAYVPHKKAIEYMFASNVLLLIIPEVKNNEGIVPGKVFEYLATNRSILAITPNNSNVADIVNETQSGYSCKANNHKEIEKKITQFYQESKADKQVLSRNDKYSRENLTKILLKEIEQL